VKDAAQDVAKDVTQDVVFSGGRDRGFLFSPRFSFNSTHTLASHQMEWGGSGGKGHKGKGGGGNWRGGRGGGGGGGKGGGRNWADPVWRAAKLADMGAKCPRLAVCVRSMGPRLEAWANGSEESDELHLTEASF